MQPGLRPFQIERYFAEHEFTAAYPLSCSDCESLTLSEVLKLGDAEILRVWENLSLHYTEPAGHPQLINLIKNIFYVEKKELLEVVEVVPQEGIYLAMLAILTSSEDEVIAVQPAYQSLQEVALSLGCRVNLWELYEDYDKGVQEFRIEDLEKLFTPKTKLLVINFPHNPTGYQPSLQEYNRIVELCAAHQCYLFSDEIYRGIEHSALAGNSAVQRLPSASTLYDKCVSLGGLSKVYSTPGLRVGWLASQNKQWLARVKEIKDYTTICGSSPSEILGIIVLQNADKISQGNRNIINENLEHTQRFMHKHSDKFHYFQPKAGTICFPALKESFCNSAEKFCAHLIAKHGILLVPGIHFGQPAGDRHIRLGLGRVDYRKNLDRLDEVISDPSINSIFQQQQ